MQAHLFESGVHLSKAINGGSMTSECSTRMFSSLCLSTLRYIATRPFHQIFTLYLKNLFIEKKSLKICLSLKFTYIILCINSNQHPLDVLPFNLIKSFRIYLQICLKSKILYTNKKIKRN